MSGELRILGMTHGLLLGLVLASPAIGTGLLPWGIEALFIVAAFQLRLADRRWEMRAGWRGWASHIRMAPARLVPWGGIAVVSLMASPEQASRAGAILTAVLLGELLIYPVGANLLGRLPRRGLGGAILLLLICCGLGQPEQAGRLAAAFALGMAGCVFWMRGPDGEPHATMLSAACTIAAFALALLLPASARFALPAGILAATLTLAHLSVARRHPQHWRLPSGLSNLRWRLSGGSERS